jgi:hypothetical protein
MMPDGHALATVAVQGYEQYTTQVAYWPELLNEPTGNPSGYGPALGARWIAKEAAKAAPSLVADGLKHKQAALADAQAALAALPAAPPEPEPDPNADQRAALQAQVASLHQEITDLTALQAIVQADAIPRIDDFYAALIASLAANDPRIPQYREEWAAAKALFAAPVLPATI